MALSPGARVGPYEVTALIGRGGMGEVWRSTDTALQRQVAIKVLPDAFAQDAERLARFEREAKTLAALNHPNIAAIYGLERSASGTALVMELVEGEDLSQRIARGAIPLDEALPIAKQIAEALEAAHEQGIVHRDLKPANVKVKADGTVKVLDFGLAKALVSEGASAPVDLTNSPTITSPAMTQMGMILGTAAYMSPEQARGKPVNKRADIWAFGCVLYEMLTGKRAFNGDDVTDTLANVLKTDPDWTPLSTSVPGRVADVVRRCLEKDSKRRIPDIAAVRYLLDEPAASAQSREMVDTHASTARGQTIRVAIMAGVMAAAAAAATMWLATRTTSAPAGDSQVMRFKIVPSADRPSMMRDYYRGLALSPDGTRLVYGGGGTALPQPLILRTLDRFDETILAGTEGARYPFFSPDGKWVGFLTANGEVRKTPVVGGPVGTVARLSGIASPSGATWGPRGIVVSGSRGAGLFEIPDTGGEPGQLARPNADAHEQDFSSPEALPNGRGVLLSVDITGSVEQYVAIFDFSTGRIKKLTSAGKSPRFVEDRNAPPAGFLVYVDGSTARAVRFDPDTLETVGPTESVLENVAGIGPSSQFTVSRNGLLVYVPGGQGAARDLRWIDRNGNETPIAPTRSYAFLRLSPDDDRIALDLRDPGARLWIWNVARRTLTPLTSGPGELFPVWTPDGRSIIYASGPNGARQLLKRPTDGSGQPQPLAEAAADLIPTSLSPDGVVVVAQAPGSIVTIGAQTRSPIVPLLQGPFNQRNGDVSPDGRWIAYESNESGQLEIYVRPFPNVNGPQVTASVGGGRMPSWNRSGGELFYLALDGGLMAVPYRPSPSLNFDAPKRLFHLAPPPNNPGRIYDATRDGRRFAVLKDVDIPLQFSVVVNWVDEVRAALAGAAQ